MPASQIEIALAVTGLATAAIALGSQWLDRQPLGAPMVAALIGVAAGPSGLGLVQPDAWGALPPLIEQAARVTVAIGVMGVALRLKRPAVRVLAAPVALLLTLGMLLMWGLSTLAAWLCLGVPLPLAALIGAVVTPTDPVVASSIVTGPFARHKLPRRLRDALSFEAGANDGLGYLFVTGALMVVLGVPDQPWTVWLRDDLLRGVLLGAGIGALVGLGAARLLAASSRRQMIEEQSFLSFTLALSLGTLGLAGAFGADGILSVFVAGLTFNFTAPVDAEETEENVQEAVNKLFALPLFVLFGALLPVSVWTAAGWPMLAFAALVLVLRRPPTMLALSPGLRSTLNARDMAFAGWFGPVGVAALFYAAMAWRHGADPLVWHAATAAVAASLVAHGVTSAPLMTLYARRSGRVPPRSVPVQPITVAERQS